MPLLFVFLIVSLGSDDITCDSLLPSGTNDTVRRKGVFKSAVMLDAAVVVEISRELRLDLGGKAILVLVALGEGISILSRLVCDDLGSGGI